MLTSEDCYAIWAPDGSRWSEWAKPAAFSPAFEPPAAPLPPISVPGLPESWKDAAIVVDLPGAEAVEVGMLLAERGYRPVPLFNATYGPNAVIHVEPLTIALFAHAATLARMPIRPEAEPAFLLDSRRTDTVGAATPGWYDNRWVVLPQDLPSAAYLRSHRIDTVTLVQRGDLHPAIDLSHVLLRWQQAGIRLSVVDLASGQVQDNVQVREPSFFRRAWWTAIALFGLRRSNVGGFGSMVPEQTSSGRGGFYG